MIITIDGPSGTGKTTIAQRLAQKLGFAYFDTGAMYRALTWLVLEKGIDLADGARLEALLRNFSFAIKDLQGDKRYFVGNVDVTSEIRMQRITAFVSAVSALPLVRAALLNIQRDFGKRGDSVFEGRDLGTVVFPKAELKIYLTARPEVRARRRLDEILAKYPEEASKYNLDKMLADIIRRDTHDSTRALAPLKCPVDAYQIDTSSSTIEQVVELILQYKASKLG